MIKRNAFVDIAPIGFGEVRHDASAGDNVEAMLGMVDGLKHGDESRASITFFVHAGAVAMEFDHLPPILFGHLVHHPFEPVEGTLLSRHPVEVCPPCLELLTATLHRCCSLLHSLLFLLYLLQPLHHVLHYAYHWGSPYSQPHQQNHLVLPVVLCWSPVWPINQNFRETSAP